MQIRPEYPQLNYGHSFANGLMFGGLLPSRFVGTTWFHDSSLYGNHGTLTAEPATDWVFSPAINRWALDFATNDCISCNTKLFSTSSADEPLSFGMWLKTTSAANAGLIGQYVGGDTNRFIFNVSINSSTKLGYFHGGSICNTTQAVNTGAWIHVGFSRTAAGAVTLYVNGVADGTGTANKAFANNNTYIGSYDASVGFLTGQFADPMLAKTVWPATVFQQLADPSNVMLSGLILPPTRKLWPVAVGGAPAGISASAVCTGTNATVSANATVRVAASAVATGTSGTVAAAATVTIAATSACVGGNATTTAAAKVAISASAVCAGANAVVVARIGEAPAETYKPMMFMVC